MGFEIEVNGAVYSVEAEGLSLLDVVRDIAGVRSAKDGCSPQGQCGCCTVLVDGEPRVACVTPARRMAGRSVETIEGLDPGDTQRWADAMVLTGGSQCGFCTPGILMRLEWLRRRGSLGDPAKVERSLAAHLCRCTGWNTVVEAAALVDEPSRAVAEPGRRDPAAAARRASIEGRVPQVVGRDVVLGRAPFAADTAPAGALVAVPDGAGGWVLGESVAEARAKVTKVQGRRTPTGSAAPIELPDGSWDVVLQTGWVEPAYLETDASWCEPGGEPRGPLANGGAFGGKVASPLPEVARRLADTTGRAVLVLWSREDCVRWGPKRPPIAAGLTSDGGGIVRVARTPGVAEVIAAVLPAVTVEEVDLVGPPTSLAPRGAGWAEASVLRAALTSDDTVRSPEGGSARAALDDRGIRIAVRCGDPLDEVVLGSYCVGAAHMAVGWVTSESLTVAPDGDVQDLTIRSFGILRASEMPPVTLEIEEDDGAPVNGSDAVFAAVAAALWRIQGLPGVWPTGIAFPA